MMRISLIVIVITVLGACSSNPPVALQETPAFDSIALTIKDPHVLHRDVELKEKRDGTKAGLELIAYAPVGCASAGMMYGLCLSMAPMFPFIMANSVQRPEKSNEEMEMLLRSLGKFDLSERFETAVVGRVETDGVFLTAPDAEPTPLQYGFTAEIGVINVKHSGTEGGTIELEIPFTFTLIDQKGALIKSHTVNRTLMFVEYQWRRYVYELFTRRLELMLDDVVQEGVGEVLTYWHPNMELKALSPQPQPRHSLIGFPYIDWPYVESTTPMLEWTSLKAIIQPEDWQYVTDVSYGVDVISKHYTKLSGGYDERAVYAISDLTEPRFHIDTPLAPCMSYLWRPSARFNYRGSPRRTRLNKDFVLNTPGPDCKHPAYWFSE